MSEGYERMKARRAARDASGIAYVDGSIYENMAACVVRSGITLAHVHDYGVAVEIAAALNATPSQGLDAATVERCARAIAEARHGVGVWNERNMNEVEQNDFRHQARAALRAAALATDPHQHGGKA